MRSRLICILFLGSSVSVPCLAAQVEEAVSPELQAHCQETKALLFNTAAPDSLLAAIQLLVPCGISGPPAVATIWDTLGASPGPRFLPSLERISRAMRDTRILSALGDAARDRGRPTEVRFGALRVLMSYLEPRLQVLPGQLETLDGPVRSPTHRVQTLTPSPLSENAPVAVGVIFRDLSFDPELGAAVQYLRQEAAYWNPSAVALTSQAIKVHYLCGNRFRIRNKDNIAIQVGYEVQETGEESVVNMEARPEQGPPSETIFTTRTTGTVQILYNGEVLATERNKGKGCK